MLRHGCTLILNDRSLYSVSVGATLNLATPKDATIERQHVREGAEKGASSIINGRSRPKTAAPLEVKSGMLPTHPTPPRQKLSSPPLLSASKAPLSLTCVMSAGH
jgi:hypothetical protein